MGMHGYKVFEPDWTCRGFQYAVGETFAMDEEPIACVRGFHFCERLVDCFNYYSFDPRNKVAEVHALGTVATNDNSINRKYCTNKIMIVRELSWSEVLRMVNIGEGCRGIRNTGAYNVGDGNAGYGNTGNFNTGNYNDGSFNSGNFNAGHYNTGSHNDGYWNIGNFNSGDSNAGNFNKGNLNVGDWNAGDHTSGCFNTEQAPLMMFNKPTTMTDRDWRRSKAYNIMFSCPPKPENRQAWWENLPWAQRASVLDLPNFDADIFRECTGIDVTTTGKED